MCQKPEDLNNDTSDLDIVHCAILREADSILATQLIVMFLHLLSHNSVSDNSKPVHITSVFHGGRRNKPLSWLISFVSALSGHWYAMVYVSACYKLLFTLAIWFQKVPHLQIALSWLRWTDRQPSSFARGMLMWYISTTEKLFPRSITHVIPVNSNS